MARGTNLRKIELANMSNHYISTLLLLLTINKSIKMDNNEDITTKKTVRSCQEQDRLIKSNKTENYQLIDVELKDTFSLDCHYCSESDDAQPKLWYKISKRNSTAGEVVQDMENNSTLNRVSVSLDHTLTIKNAKFSDGGIYFCQNKQDDEIENNVNFIIDIIFGNNTPPEVGNLTEWLRFHEHNMKPINRALQYSNGTEFRFVREVLKLNLQVVTEWDISWGICEVCGRPQGEGTQEKMGHCRVKIINYEKNEINITDQLYKSRFNFFINTSEVSCKSMLLFELFPDISNITRTLPDFVQSRFCDGICNPNAIGYNSGWKFGSSTGYKYRKIFVLAQKAHLTIVCPEATLDNAVIWRRNGHVLTRGKTDVKEGAEPHVYVDTFNTLYLIDVSAEDEGNYTCQVDDIRMQQVRVFVVSKTRLLTKAFLRHMMYLAVVLSLSSFCYCAGLLIACRKRHTFRGYAEVPTEIVDSACDPDCCKVP